MRRTWRGGQKRSDEADGECGVSGGQGGGEGKVRWRGGKEEGQSEEGGEREDGGVDDEESRRRHCWEWLEGIVEGRPLLNQVVGETGEHERRG